MKSITLFVLILLAGNTYSQKLHQVTIPGATNLSHFSVLTEQNVLIRISPEGQILEWGTEVMSDRYNYYATKLQPFLARTEYFDQLSDSAYRGKVKSIGTTFITYYGANETVERKGKLKLLGNLQFDYYSNYDDKLIRGKLRTIGSLNIEYYRSIDNEVLRGKLKAIGSTNITYYTVFDDKHNAGKLKNIGGVNYAWYSAYDVSYLRGGLKNNQYRQTIGAITYILQ